MTAERSRISTILEAMKRRVVRRWRIILPSKPTSRRTMPRQCSAKLPRSAGDTPQTDPLSAAMSQVQNPQVGAGGGGDQ